MYVMKSRELRVGLAAGATAATLIGCGETHPNPQTQINNYLQPVAAKIAERALCALAPTPEQSLESDHPNLNGDNYGGVQFWFYAKQAGESYTLTFSVPVINHQPLPDKAYKVIVYESPKDGNAMDSIVQIGTTPIAADQGFWFGVTKKVEYQGDNPGVSGDGTYIHEPEDAQTYIPVHASEAVIQRHESLARNIAYIAQHKANIIFSRKKDYCSPKKL